MSLEAGSLVGLSLGTDELEIVCQSCRPLIDALLKLLRKEEQPESVVVVPPPPGVVAVVVSVVVVVGVVADAVAADSLYFKRPQPRLQPQLSVGHVDFDRRSVSHTFGKHRRTK